MNVELKKFENSNYYPGGGFLKRALWYCVNGLIFHSWLFPCSVMKCAILRWFGAKVGRNVVMKPRINIKYPWFLDIGDYVWLGEGVWIDNLAMVRIKDNVCISQGAYLLTGNHDYTDASFQLIVKGISLEKGVWVGAMSVVCPGVSMAEHSILSVSSVLQSDTEPYGIYRGNPAVKIRERNIG